MTINVIMAGEPSNGGGLPPEITSTPPVDPSPPKRPPKPPRPKHRNVCKE
jgi:hypothetical protein